LWLGFCFNKLFPFFIRGFQAPVLGASGSIMAVLVAFAYINPEREFFYSLCPFLLMQEE
jgi:membrane associated rhomboid family serine protease